MANQIPEPEWMSRTFGRATTDWSGAQLEVRAHLIATARRRSVATYLEIRDSISSTKIPATGSAFGDAIGLLLGQVNLIESKPLGKPMMLSAVAVKNDLHPGPGFESLIEQLGWKGDWPTWLAKVWRYYSAAG